MDTIESQRIADSLNAMRITSEETKSPVVHNIPIIVLPVGIAGMRKTRLTEAAKRYAEER